MTTRFDVDTDVVLDVGPRVVDEAPAVVVEVPAPVVVALVVELDEHAGQAQRPHDDDRNDSQRCAPVLDLRVPVRPGRARGRRDAALG